jgi:HK97 family phage portal protein
MEFISLNLQSEVRVAPPTPSPLENPAISLSAGLASLGYGTYTDSNERVTEQSSLEVPTFLACVRILSEGVGSLPMRVYEELERGRRPAKNHDLYYLLTQEPNPESTAVTFFTTMMIHAAVWQNAYAEIERNGYGKPIAFWIRLPWRTKRVGNALTGYYETTDTAGGVPRRVKSEDMIHIPGFSLDGFNGSSLVAMGRQSIGLAMVAARFGARFYANGAKPSFFLQPESPLSPEDMTLLRQDVELMSSGSNVWRVAALPPGIKTTEIKIEPATAQYNETRKFEREEIAAIMRVPGYMVGATDKALKSSIEAQNMEFLTYSLRPWIERFEQEFNRKLLPPIGRASGKYSIHFWTDAILAVDKKTRTECYTAGRNGGWLSINDIRELEGYEVIDGGDTYIQPLNMQNVTADDEGMETDDEVEVQDNEPTIAPTIEPTPTRAKEVFLPLMRDAINRIQHRAKKDSGTFNQSLAPVCQALAAALRTGEPGAEEQKAIEKYISGAESRSTKWTEDPTEDEFVKLHKALVFAINRDAADAKSKEELSHE